MQALKAAEKIIADENEPLSKLTDVEITQTELSNSNYKQLSKENSAFYDTIYSLSEGETAYFGENTLIWCFSRNFSGYESYSSVESTVIAEYRQQQYEKYIKYHNEGGCKLGDNIYCTQQHVLCTLPHLGQKVLCTIALQ